MTLRLFSELDNGTRFYFYETYGQARLKKLDNTHYEDVDGEVKIVSPSILVFTAGDYNEHDNPRACVGYLEQGYIHCVYCAHDTDTKVYLSNIAPYKQTCAKCHRVVVDGRTNKWPDLL